jgi:hypothetical protein
MYVRGQGGDRSHASRTTATSSARSWRTPKPPDPLGCRVQFRATTQAGRLRSSGSSDRRRSAAPAVDVEVLAVGDRFCEAEAREGRSSELDRRWRCRPAYREKLIAYLEREASSTKTAGQRGPTHSACSTKVDGRRRSCSARSSRNLCQPCAEHRGGAQRTRRGGDRAVHIAWCAGWTCTRTAFEFVSVVRGAGCDRRSGRYDRLAEVWAAPTPGVGSLGLDRPIALRRRSRERSGRRASS